MKNKEVSFKRTARERIDIDACVARLRGLGQISTGDEVLHHRMNLAACNANGCPLDFQKLLRFDDFSFLHDMLGIDRFMNRRTGKLMNCFDPRCSKPKSAA